MKSTKKIVLMALATALAVIMLGASAYALTQTVTLKTDKTNFAAGELVNVVVHYDADAQNDLAVLVCFDSNVLTFKDKTPDPTCGAVCDPGILEAYPEETGFEDTDATTDVHLSLYYPIDEATQGSPWKAQPPLDVVTLQFEVKAGVADNTKTKINVVDSGYFTQNFTPASLELTIGGVQPPVPTPLEIADAVAAIGDTIIAANTADYATQRIANAILADALPAAPGPRLWVYGTTAEEAKALAESLIANGYTNVSYLNVPFTTFANDPSVSNDKVEYKLTVTIAGTGNGTVSDGTQNVTEKWYTKGTEVTLTATPADANSQFDGFSVDATGTAPVTLTMDPSKNVTATFSPVGTVNQPPVANPLSFTTEYNKQWSEQPLTGSDPDGDTITFSIATPATNGIVSSLDSNTGAFVYAPNDGYSGPDSFTFKVNDGKVDSAPAIVTITVKPIPATYTVNFAAGANGSITGTASQTVAENGDCTAVTAVPAQGYQFDGWTGDFVGTANPLTVTNVTKNMNVTANFSVIPGVTYTVNFAAGANGSITGTASQTVAENGDCTAVTAVPAQGYQFDGWTGDFVGTANPLTVSNVTKNMNITANFSVIPDITPDGDGNGDRYVDIYDALTAAMYNAGMLTEAEIARFAHLDVEGNGNGVDINDALAIAKYDVGLPCDCTLDE